MDSRRQLAFNAVDLLVLCAFGAAQPLYDLLSRNPGFLVARHSPPSDILITAVGLSLVFPGLLVGLEAVVAIFGAKALRIGHTILTGLLISTIALPPLNRIFEGAGWWKLCVIVSLSLALSTFYVRVRTRRLSALFLSPAVIIFPLLFLFRPPISDLLLERGEWKRASSAIGKPVPIVMLILDEFPLSSLLDSESLIDSVQYPNFASMASEFTWYRNATSVSDGTLNAVPAILDGRYPQPNLGLLPQVNDFPQTLFTMLAGTYGFNVHESNTRLCPNELCEEAGQSSPRAKRIRGIFDDLSLVYLYTLLPTNLARNLPSISNSYKEFLTPTLSTLDDFHDLMEWSGRPGQFKDFVASISPSTRPVLHFLHILLPHAPWQFLPTGKTYTFDDKLRGLVGPNPKPEDPDRWTDDAWAVTQSYQQHLLQVGFVDRLLGLLIRRLKDTGVYDSALIVITADHGSSFRPNASRRRPSPANYVDILSVPLFIKQPFQTKGGIDDRNVETVDILPTLAEILDARMTWKTEGKSFASSVAPEKTHKMFVTASLGNIFLTSQAYAAFDKVENKVRLFGSARGPDGLYQVGPHREIVGLPISRFKETRTDKVHCEIEHMNHYSNVDLQGQFLLTMLKGRLVRDRQGPFHPLQLAIAINGVVRGVSESYENENGEEFSAIVPESAFHQGQNEVAVFSMVGSSSPTLELLAHNETEKYQWGKVISFKAGGNAKFYQGLGWGTAEAGNTWTTESQAHLIFALSAANTSLDLTFQFRAFLLPGKVDSQFVRLFVNSHLVKEFRIDSSEAQRPTVRIDKEFLNSIGPTVITFEIPTAIVPASLGAGIDQRLLGISFEWLRLLPVQNPES